MKKYAIIDFKGKEGLESSIVPNKWIVREDHECYWPDKDYSRAVIDCLEPDTTWALFPYVSVKYETDDYPRAAEKLKQLLQGYSDIGSTSESAVSGHRRKRIRYKRCVSTSESDEENVPEYSLLPSKKSRLHDSPLSLPKLQFKELGNMQSEQASSTFSPTPNSSSMWPQPAASQPVSMQPQPAASQPLSMRPKPAASQPLSMRPQPAASQPLSMQPQPAASQPLSMRPQPAASQPLSMQPQPAASQPLSMQPQPAASQPLSMRPQPTVRPLALRRQPAPHLLARPQRSSEDHILTGSSTNNLTNTLLTKLIKGQEELSQHLHQISQQLCQNTIILQNLATSQGMASAAVPDGLLLPLESQEQMNQLEEALMDKDFRTKVIQHLSCIGGDSVSSLVRRILRRLFCTELSLKYNFSGAKGKNSFHPLQMRGVLIAAVRRTFNGASEADIDSVTRKWFSNARDRDGGRARRTSDGVRNN